MDRLNLPKKVYFKSGSTPIALKELHEIYGCKRALLVSDPAMYKAGFITPVGNILRDYGIRTAEFFSLHPIPSYANIRNSLPKLQEFLPDVIVGVGGGGVMSAAKVLAALCENPSIDPAAFEKGAVIPVRKNIILVLIATTFGSGSQNSPFAVLENDAHAKTVLHSFSLLPDISITDAQFVQTLTAKQVRKAGLTTLSAIIRTYQSESCSEFAQGLLQEAAAAILEYLRYGENGCPTAREKLHNAGAIAGTAYGNVLKTFDPDLPLFPAKGDDLSTARLTQLAVQLGYSDIAALAKVCISLR